MGMLLPNPACNSQQGILPPWVRAVSYALQRIPTRCPGKARLARWALGEVLQRTDVVIDAVSASFLVPHLSEPVAFHLLVNGKYEPATDECLRTLLKSGDLFVDVGANIGVRFAAGVCLGMRPRNLLANVRFKPLHRAFICGVYLFFTCVGLLTPIAAFDYCRPRLYAISKSLFQRATPSCV